MDLSVVKEFEAEAAERLPGFQVLFKDGSFWQRLLGLLVWPFNKSYMTSFTTTFGNTVYFPTKAFYEEVPDRSFTILAHEFVHAVDGEKNGPWLKLSYLLPQALFVPLLAAGLLGLFFCGWSWLLVLAAFVSLAPWPAPWRAKWEARGYTMTLAVTQWMHGSTSAAQRESIASEFYGPSYFRMVWGKEKARQLVEECAAYAASTRILTEDPYSTVHSFLQKHGVLGGA